MSAISQFDMEHYRLINERRKEHLDWLLDNALAGFRHCTVADLGCGPGFFADHMQRRGYSVHAFDGRAENVQEAGSRYPAIPFSTWDIEDALRRPSGSYDLVLCLGLLYHVENPFLAIRNLHAITGRVAIIESVTAAHQLPVAVLYDEPARGAAQALNFIALIPSEAAFVKMLYAAGFSHVYKPVTLPDHDEFRPDAPKRRTVLIASRAELASPTIVKRDNIPNTCIRLDDSKAAS